MRSKRYRTGLFGALLLLFATAARGAQIESGQIAGVPEGGLTVYKGVPFAAPPLGDLRWRAPEPPKPWSGVRRADAFAPACMQTGISMPGEAPPKVSEDCLYLNIWTPTEDPKAGLPVLVWIYGGGFSNGSASMPLYWGDRLARKGVVVVTIAYRVGVFGFLSHPELTRKSPHRSSGNYGLMDQIAALRWVQRNIGTFGGDPKRVTVAGQSAGSMSVSILMASPQAQGLFQRAIGQSGGFFEPVQLGPQFLLKNAEHDGETYAASLGATSVAALRALPASALLKKSAPSGSHPVIEPYVLPEPPFDVFAAGRQANVPILIGSNAEEARALVDVTNVKAATFATDIEKAFRALPPPLIGAYPAGNDAEARSARIAFESDLRFRWDMWAWARLHTPKNKVFAYDFTHKPPFPEGSVRARWGASHFAELWYVFDHLDQEPWRWSAADRRLAATISDYWVNFVKTGDPNAAGLSSWPVFEKANGPVQMLGERIAPGEVGRLKALQVFDDVYGQLRATPLP